MNGEDLRYKSFAGLVHDDGVLIRLFTDSIGTYLDKIGSSQG